MSATKQRAIMKFKDPSFIEAFYSVLHETGKVKVQGIGIFEIKRVKARESYNVRAGTRFTIPEHNKVAFRPGKKLKDFIQTHGTQN